MEEVGGASFLGFILVLIEGVLSAYGKGYKHRIRNIREILPTKRNVMNIKKHKSRRRGNYNEKLEHVFFHEAFCEVFLSNHYVLCVGCMRWRGFVHNAHVV